MRVLKMLGALALLGVAFGGGYLMHGRRPPVAAPAARTVLYYVDPMHPAYTSDKPGKAPDCGMDLEPVYADDGATAAGAQRKVLYYRDPSAPSYTATTPGVNPSTGRALEPVYAEAPEPGAPAGALRIPLDRQHLAGVTWATVEATDTAGVLRTVGKVTYDERKVQHVHARVDGFVERVLVDFTGQQVRRGQPMLTIYSPELLASQEELLLARRARELMQKSPLGTGAQQGDALFQAARRRLQLWNLTDAQVEQVLATGQPIRDITLYAPAGGFVLERNVFPNQRVTADTDLYTLADLSSVWVMADLFEADLAAVKAGARARIILPNGTAATAIEATAAYVQPAVDPTTRTLKVRLEARNPGMRLRPEMFVDVEFPLAGGRRLTVPADAVLDSGERQVVFVDLGDGYLTPKTVHVGERFGDRLVVLDGLTEGDRVVASGTFLIDAESQLRSAGLAPLAPPAPPPPPVGAPAGAPAPTVTPAAPRPLAPAPAASGHEHHHD